MVEDLSIIDLDFLGDGKVSDLLDNEFLKFDPKILEGLNKYDTLLKLYHEEDLKTLTNILIQMFNANIIDLAEGGDPKYPIIYQNRIYGMVALQ